MTGPTAAQIEEHHEAGVGWDECCGMSDPDGEGRYELCECCGGEYEEPSHRRGSNWDVCLQCRRSCTRYQACDRWGGTRLEIECQG